MNEGCSPWASAVFADVAGFVSMHLSQVVSIWRGNVGVHVARITARITAGAFKQADNVHISATLRMACAISRAAVCLRMMILIATMHSLLVVMHQLRGM